jgi:NADH-quinone oxidoreductase subunit L
MTIPLIILSVFAVGAGWVGIPSDFLGLKLPSNWFHEFLGGTLLHHPEAVGFNFFPLAVSLVVALGGLALGWLVYRSVPAGAEDPLKRPLGPIYTLLQNKYNIDELYSYLFVRPANWFAEQFTYLFLDRRLIDGLLHGVAEVSLNLGSGLREVIDVRMVNRFGDLVGSLTNRFGHWFRQIQTGRVQQYMIYAAFIAFAGLFYYLIILQP